MDAMNDLHLEKLIASNISGTKTAQRLKQAESSSTQMNKEKMMHGRSRNVDSV